MDAQQKRVLRRKRHIVASTIEWDEDLEKAFRDRGLLTDGMCDAMQVCKVKDDFKKM